MFRWFQTPQKTIIKAPPTPKMVQAKIPSSQKVELTKTPHENLIEFLEKRELKAQADNLKKDATSLYLLRNKIGDAGATELARVLKDNSTLTSLYLLRNKIGDAGATELARVLKDNSTLTSLYLLRNKIGDAGATELARVLKDNSTLTSLDLLRNKIGEVGATELARVLKDNSTLTSIDFSDNNIGIAGAKELALMLKANSTITAINLNYNGIKDKELENIDNSIKHNKLIKLVKNLAIFLKESYSDKQVASDNFVKSASVARCCKKTKVSKELLKKHLQECKFENSESIIEGISKLHPFHISGICKNIKAKEGVLSHCKELGYPNGHIEKLPLETLLHITSYLEHTPWGWEVEGKDNNSELDLAGLTGLANNQTPPAG